MKIHEYQAKELLRHYGVPVPQGCLCTDLEEAKQRLDALGDGKLVVKAQVHSGGRGKAGGVRIVDGSSAAVLAVEDMLGMTLFTNQDPEGRKVRKVYVERAADIEQELYLSLLLDRAEGALCFVACNEGGVEIEEIAQEDRARLQRGEVEQGRIKKVFVPPSLGWSEYIGRKLAYEMGFSGEKSLALADLASKLYHLYQCEDASMVEINPLVVDGKGNFIALDGKIALEDNGAFRHPERKELRDLDEENPLELEASKARLSYVALQGSIGCMVNGAGLAMATMDAIKQEGAEPANFLDVGGGASADSVAKAFGLIQRDQGVAAILVNIFGGIVKCDLVAKGILHALNEVELKVPLVVRLQGTNSGEAMNLLDESSLDIRLAQGLKEAAEKVVAAARGEGQ